MKTKIKDSVLFGAMLVLTTFAIMATLNNEAKALTFLKATSKGIVKIDESQPVCIYIKRQYRPVTKSALLAVCAAGRATCDDKAEEVLFQTTGKTFVKLNKTKLGEGKYNEIKRLVYAGKGAKTCDEVLK